MRHEADQLKSRLQDHRLLARFRRVFTGKGERDRLDKLEASIQDAETRKLDALNALIKRQNIDRAKLAEKQEQRLTAQHEGIERAKECKRQLTLERIEQMRERRQERQKDRGQDFEP
ncbi:hypothetical protein RA28_20995 [Ruegeria sp. ANG-S4]|uniref:hypothetical protein n=1 Tax=Ruegeria sp. ANG-S4 TaxID=1577904 RepID=UPI00057D8EDD|nr:hypothetical protein [Ruegeria sp. ANG-S4]KIC41356.1 hypothetical protein RA28_20995 [Ruegeria sp. ANG-S4]